MIKSFKAIRYFMRLASLSVHEMFHVLMIILLYPFGVKCYHFRAYTDEDGNLRMKVTHEMKKGRFNPLLKLLIAIAPSMFWLLWIALAMWNEHYLMVVLLILNHEYLKNSPSDSDNANEYWKALIKVYDK